MKSIVPWAVMPCSLVEFSWYFEWMYCLNLHGQRVYRTSNNPGVISKQNALLASCLLACLLGLLFDPAGGVICSPKCQGDFYNTIVLHLRKQHICSHSHKSLKSDIITAVSVVILLLQNGILMWYIALYYCFHLTTHTRCCNFIHSDAHFISLYQFNTISMLVTIWVKHWY